MQVISHRTREFYCSRAQTFKGRTSCFKLLTLWINCFTALSRGILTDSDSATFAPMVQLEGISRGLGGTLPLHVLYK